MKKIWKIVSMILILVCIIATVFGVYGYKHFWFSKYDKIIKYDNNTIGLGILYEPGLSSDVVIVPSNYRGYRVSYVGVSTNGITKIVMPDDLNYFDIEICNDLKEIVMPINFDSEKSFIPSDYKTSVTLIVKENSKAKQYAIDHGYQYRIEE